MCEGAFIGYKFSKRNNMLVKWMISGDQMIFFLDTFVFKTCSLVIINEMSVGYQYIVIRCQLCKVFKSMRVGSLMSCHALVYAEE